MYPITSIKSIGHLYGTVLGSIVLPQRRFPRSYPQNPYICVFWQRQRNVHFLTGIPNETVAVSSEISRSGHKIPLKMSLTSKFETPELFCTPNRMHQLPASTGTPVPITLREALDPSFPGQGFPGPGIFENFAKSRFSGPFP